MNQKLLLDILSQKFTYLTEGLQTFIYISEDGKYVLKTFKSLEQSKDQFKKWGFSLDEITEELISNSEKSYKLAFEELRTETALVYIHLSNEELPIQDIVLGEETLIAKNLQFILQDKVELVRDRITRLMSTGDIKGAQEVIVDIMNFIISIWKKNITEDTFNWDHNYGYTSDQILVQIDVGTFWKGEKYLQEEFVHKKLSNNVSSRWLGDKYPDLLDFYNEQAEMLYKNVNVEGFLK